jgi:protein tyrosine/serine phosphatase
MEPAAPRKPSRRKRLAIALAIAAVVAGSAAFVIKDYVFHARFETVVEGKVYRSFQPSPEELRDWTARYGIRSVINLRGQSADLPKEEAATREANVTLYTFRFSASHQPSREELVRLIDVLETAEKPILIHCRQGVDRTGTVSVLAAMAIGGQSLGQAKTHLPMVKTSKGHDDISDLIADFQKYRKDNNSLDDSWATFRHWATEVRKTGTGE